MAQGPRWTARGGRSADKKGPSRVPYRTEPALSLRRAPSCRRPLSLCPWIKYSRSNICKVTKETFTQRWNSSPTSLLTLSAYLCASCLATCPSFGPKYPAACPQICLTYMWSEFWQCSVHLGECNILSFAVEVISINARQLWHSHKSNCYPAAALWDATATLHCLFVKAVTCVCVHVRMNRALGEIKGLFPTQQEQSPWP